MKSLSRGLAATLVMFSLAGCGGPKYESGPPAAASKDELPTFVKQLASKQGIARKFAYTRLEQMGPEANTPEVLKALDDAKKRTSDTDEKKRVDEVKAKITGGAAPAAK